MVNHKLRMGSELLLAVLYHRRGMRLDEAKAKGQI